MTSGRTSIQGVHALDATYERRSYTNRFKLDVVTFYLAGRRANGKVQRGHMDVTIGRFFPDISFDAKESVRKMIHRWCKKIDRIRVKASTAKGGASRRSRPVGTATVLPASAEESIAEWVHDLRRDGVPVSAAMLRLQALEVAREYGLPDGAFAASTQWRKGFIMRHKLAFRAATHQSQVPLAEAEHAAAVFAQQVRATIEALGITEVYNADQTAVTFELLPKRTLHERGDKTVWVKCAGKDKERATVMLLGKMDGSKLPPFVVFKTRPATKAEVQVANNETRQGFGRTLWEEIRGLQDEYDMKIYGNRAGWWNSTIMESFLRFHFGDRHCRSPPILLLLDHFSAHWTKEVKEYAQSKSIVLMKIPAGLTWRSQPADVAWMKPFKDSLRRSWVENLREQLMARIAGVPFKLTAPKRKTVCKWIKTAWESLTAKTIRGGFVKCGFVVGETESAISASDDEVDATEVLDALVSAGVISYAPRNVLVADMDVIDHLEL